MNELKGKCRTMKPLRSVREIMDEEYMTNGDGDGKIWTPEELEDHHRIGDLIAGKLALGYTAEQINALWAGKSTQEILAESEADGTAPHTAPGENRESKISRCIEAGIG